MALACHSGRGTLQRACGRDVRKRSRPTSVVRSASDIPPELQKAMQDPAMRERMAAMQEAMQRPEVQQQMAQMQAYMQNQQLQERMAQLKDDPEFKEVFEQIKTGGMGALMKFYNDPAFLSKLGSKLGDVPPPAAAPTAAAAARPTPAAAPPAAPEVTNLLEAARYGDLEAVEDFIAIGKDVNAADAEARTPLHFASGLGAPEVVGALLEAGATLEASDSKGNTPLHYAAGYGRVAVVKQLLAAGASPDARNANGKRPADVAALNPNNPVVGDEALMAALQQPAGASSAA